MEIINADKYFNVDRLDKIFFQSPDIGKNRSLKSAKIDDSIFVGDGMLSSLKRIVLEWTSDGSVEKCHNSTDKYPVSVVAKIRTNDNVANSEVLTNENVNSEQLFAESLKLVHPNECEFYKRVGPRIKAQGFPVPLCYAAVVLNPELGDGYIVMEDLTSNCAMVDIKEGFSKNKLFTIVENLAILHFRCLTTPAEQWKRYFRSLEEFPNFVEFVKVLGEQLLITLHENYGEFFDKIEPNFGEKILNMNMLENDGESSLKILGHGDMWIRNVLWLKEQDGSLDKIGAFIDWQFANITGLTDDIARVMIFSVKTDIRRSEERNVLLHYYEILKKLLKNDSKAEVLLKSLPSFEKLFEQYQRSFTFQAFFDLCDYGILLEEVTKICSTQNNDEKLQQPVLEMLHRGAATLLDAQEMLKKFAI